MKLLVFYLALTSIAAAGPCVSLTDAKVTAKDLTAAVPQLADVPANQFLFHAPAVGLVRILTSHDLRRLSGRSISYPDAICVERQAMRLELDQVRSAILQAIPGSPSLLEIIEMSRYAVPPGRIDFPFSGLIQLPKAKVDDVVLWNGRVIPESGGAVRIWVRLRVAIEVAVPRTKVPLSRRHVLTANDIEVRQEAVRIKDAAEGLPVDQLIGCSIMRQLGRGELLTRSSVRCLPKRPSVEETEAVVRIGNVVLKVKGNVTPSSSNSHELRFQGRGMKKVVAAQRNEKGIVEVSVP